MIMKSDPPDKRSTWNTDRSLLISLADLAFIMLFTLLISKEQYKPGSMQYSKPDFKVKLGTIAANDPEMDQWCIRFMGSDLSHFSCIRNMTHVEFRECDKTELNEKLDSIIKTINYSQNTFKILFQCSPESDFFLFLNIYQDAKMHISSKVHDSERIQVCFGMSQ